MAIQENNLLSEKDILTELCGRKGLYSPLEIVAVERQLKGADAKITLGLRGRKAAFLVAVKARTAPKVISEALWRIKSYKGRGKRNFLLVVPYLSKAIQELLTKEVISGIDLSGNYLIQAPEMLAVRLDQKNRFPESQPIKKIFSGNSSLVGRLFLAAGKRYSSVNEVWSAIKPLGGSLSLSAVSKVLKGLEEELIIEKGKKDIRLLQPEKLLQRLEEGYRPPKVTGSIKLKLPPVEGLKMTMGPWDYNRGFAGLKWVFSGESSANRYALMANDATDRVYVTDFESLRTYEDERFYNVLAQRTEDSFPFFDAQEDKGLRWASSVQCCLELSKLDKREKDVAATVREAILKKFK